MDFKKHKFWFIVGGVFLVEVLIYFIWIGGLDAKIQEKAEQISADEGSLQKILSDAKRAPLMNDRWVKHYKKKRNAYLAQWENCLQVYRERDKRFEKYFDLPKNFSHSDFYLKYKEEWNKLLTSLKDTGLFQKKEWEEELEIDQIQELGLKVSLSQPKNNEEQSILQKEFWIQEAILRTLAKFKPVQFSKIELVFEKGKPFDAKAREFRFVPPFHTFRVTVSFSTSYAKVGSIFRELLSHPYLDFYMRNLEVKKQEFQITYTQEKQDGSGQKIYRYPEYEGGKAKFFDRYLFIRLTKPEHKLPVDKIIPEPFVGVKCTLDVLDFDEALLPPKEKLLGGGKASKKKRRRGRRRR
ncbi:MAG: hypothetical protein D6805_01965 [Planctomycetota bacterium]|nr:MAG: hypothetical protein D6805_01965 [Planctomycetota bacterium]